MNATDEPATASQLIQLRQLGCEPDQKLTRIQAAQLIGTLHTRQQTSTGTSDPHGASASMNDARRLAVIVHQARDSVACQGGRAAAEIAEAALASALRERQEFWMNTCREPAQMRTHSTQAWELYRKFGCRFSVPSHEQTQEILDALDPALPSWEVEHAELFYQTLELNFPELLRHV